MQLQFIYVSCFKSDASDILPQNYSKETCLYLSIRARYPLKLTSRSLLRERTDTTKVARRLKQRRDIRTFAFPTVALGCNNVMHKMVAAFVASF